MIRLIVVLLVGSLAWMTWWALGQTAYERGLSAWIEDRRSEGWAADVGTLETAGFPNRFDTTLTDLRLADPETGVAWNAPALQFLSLAYKPHQVIAVVPQAHRFSTPLGAFDISHDDARASLFLKPETALGLDQAILVVSDLQIDADAGWETSLTSGRFAAESVPAAVNTYRLGAEVDGLTPSAPLRRLLDPAQVLPETVENLRLDATASFDRPWDRFAVEDARPQPTRIDLTDLSARWGTATFRATGELDVTEEGFPEGEITIRAEDWRKILDMAVSSGVLPPTAVGPLERGLELMSGPRDTLDATLGFRGGFVRLGIIPIAPAPRIVIR
ncbi:MAG: DUF2125 domain-containing protein [Pseudomonadota bacterium]